MEEESLLRRRILVLGPGEELVAAVLGVDLVRVWASRWMVRANRLLEIFLLFYQFTGFLLCNHI